MKIINNFVSMVILGNFNPAILTPNFLKNSCDIDLGMPKESSVTPVQSIVKYNGISFSVSLDRCQILEKKPEDFLKSKIPEYMNKYINILKYTPFFACGINFNIDVEDMDTKKIKNYIYEDKDSLKKILKAQELVLGDVIKYKSKDMEEIVNYNIGYIVEPNLIFGNITINKKDTKTYTLNYNYEVRGLDKDKNTIKLLIDEYEGRFIEFGYFIKEVL